MSAPAIGWMDVLTDYMNKNFRNSWAYTGSFAMYCRAHAEGKVAREPKDVDILTCRVDQVAYSIDSDFQGSKLRPPGKDCKFCRVNSALLVSVDIEVGMDGRVELTIVPRSIDIDVLLAGATYGNLSDCTQLKVGRSEAQVASVNQMVRAKQKTLSELPEGAERTQAQLDIGFLATLSGYSAPETSVVSAPSAAVAKVPGLDDFTL